MTARNDLRAEAEWLEMGARMAKRSKTFRDFAPVLARKAAAIRRTLAAADAAERAFFRSLEERER